MISLKNVYKSYNNVQILDNFELEFPNTGIFCIMGKSGSGKSTLFNIIAGIEEIDSGNITKQNINKISYVFQEDVLNPYVTIEKNLLLIKQDHRKVDEVLKEFEIFELKDKYTDEISRRREKKNKLGCIYFI